MWAWSDAHANMVERNVLLPFRARCDNQAEDGAGYDTDDGTDGFAKIIEGTEVLESSFPALTPRAARCGADRIADGAPGKETNSESERLLGLASAHIQTRDGVPGHQDRALARPLQDQRLVVQRPYGAL
jgi:hypothetical protein